MKLIGSCLLCLISFKIYAADDKSPLEKLKADIQNPKGGHDPALSRVRTGGKGFSFFQSKSEFDEILSSPPNFYLVYRMEARRLSKKRILEFEKELQEEISRSRQAK